MLKLKNCFLLCDTYWLLLFSIQFAQSAVSHIVLTSVQGDETVIPKSIPKLVEKIDKAIGEATVKVNEIIKNSKDICNENRVCLQPIE